MWEFIDKIIYINLDYREDRRGIMSKFFEDTKIPLEKVVRFSGIKKKSAKLGCLESHTKVLELAKNNGWKNILVLEDDLEILNFEEGYKQLEQLVELPNWDVILLTGFYWKYDFPRIFQAGNAGAYLVNEKYIDNFLKHRQHAITQMKANAAFNFKNTKYNADVHWHSLMNTDNWYGIYPCLCRQVDGYSDNVGREVTSSKIVGIASQEIKESVYDIGIKYVYKRQWDQTGKHLRLVLVRR
jgi:glycosyl transferase family 25